MFDMLASDESSEEEESDKGWRDINLDKMSMPEDDWNQSEYNILYKCLVKEGMTNVVIGLDEVFYIKNDYLHETILHRLLAVIVHDKQKYLTTKRVLIAQAYTQGKTLEELANSP